MSILEGIIGQDCSRFVALNRRLNSSLNLEDRFLTTLISNDYFYSSLNFPADKQR